VQADQVLTGLHELLGHGSGKLLREAADGSKNFQAELQHPLTGQPVHSWYRDGESYGGIFGDIASTMEECRAECVSLALADAEGVQALFGFEEAEEAACSVYIGWLHMCLLGLKALEVYDPTQQAWGQVHSWARFAILRTLLAAGALAIEEVSSRQGPSLVLRISPESIASLGKPAIEALLLRIMVYRATADVEAARPWWQALTEVDDHFLRLREIVLTKRQPRKIFVQPHTALKRQTQGDKAKEEVVLKEFDPTPEGMIHSFIVRFRDLDQPIDEGTMN